MVKESEIDRIRGKDKELFLPGLRVRVKHHKLTSITYDFIWTYDEPSDSGVNTAFKMKTGDIATIISVVDFDCRWLMLLTNDAMIGWTFELEGLEILSNAV